MKRCPRCGREYDLTMSYCLDDGSELLYGPASEPGALATGFPSDEEPKTAILPGSALFDSEGVTCPQITGAAAEPQDSQGGSTERQSLADNRAATPRGTSVGRQWQLAVVGTIAVAVLVGFLDIDTLSR
ncbi:MAG: hypothetical protein UZ17_ACD001000739 [Acidobacteria bacterium OLB17]|nr:MAG: hypothetical protein UZ17_ACD001000739 [Acidobacteria bacterium OLB17]